MRGWLNKSQRRRIKASWRDTLLLFNEFRRPLLAFIFVTVSGGLFYYFLAIAAGQALGSPIEAIYLALTLTFLQANISFPDPWYLQLFFFIMPVLGIGFLAQGLADFGVSFFNRRARAKEWEMAVASTFTNHTILIGLGHLGFRVVKLLNDMNEDIVVIELKPRVDLLDHVRDMGIPVIQDDGTREAVLTAAGGKQARAIILCTQNDSLNLEMAVKARSINPNIKVIIRIFDDDFAGALKQQFGFQALSATGMAAPLFAASAANIDLTPPITIEGVANSLARLEVTTSSSLAGCSIENIENQYHISVVLLIHGGVRSYHPSNQLQVEAKDIIVFLGEPERIILLVHANH